MDRVFSFDARIAVLVLFAFHLAPAGLRAQDPIEPAPSTPAADVSDAGEGQTQRPQKQTIPQNPLEIVQQIGWEFVAPFVVASFVALWFGLERLVVLRRGRVIPRPFVERFLEHIEQDKLDPDSALQLCEDNGSPVASVFAHGVRKWGKPSVEVEQAIIDGGERQISHLRKHLRVINGVATIAPLMGLLGTVIGMILAFNDLSGVSDVSKSEELAVDIAVALFTTAFGLAIAIPTLILYMYLSGRIDALVMQMDDLAQNVVHLISAEALNTRAARTAPKPTRKTSQRAKSAG